MASLEAGNWILRGTRTVDTAGTLVAFGLLRESSGLLLDRLVELGSSGGDNPDILTKDAILLRTAATSPREQAQRSEEVQIKTTRKDLRRHKVQTKRGFATDGYLCTKCKIEFGVKRLRGCSASCRRQQTRRKDKDNPKRVASQAQLPRNSDDLKRQGHRAYASA